MYYKAMYDQAVKDKTVKVITPKYVEFEKKGDVIVGQFKGFSVVKSSRDDSTYNQYIFNTDLGMVKFALGSATDKEVSHVMNPGGIYAVTFYGKEDLGKGRSVNKFQVEEVFPPEKSETENPDDIPF